MNKNGLKEIETEEAQTMIAILTTSTYHDAAIALGLTDEGLIKRRRRLNIDEKIASLPKEALQRLQIYSIKAADTFGRNLSHPHKDMDAAKEILDRVGVGKGPQVLIQNNQVINEVEFILDES